MAMVECIHESFTAVKKLRDLEVKLSVPLLLKTNSYWHALWTSVTSFLLKTKWLNWK